MPPSGGMSSKRMANARIGPGPIIPLSLLPFGSVVLVTVGSCPVDGFVPAVSLPTDTDADDVPVPPAGTSPIDVGTAQPPSNTHTKTLTKDIMGQSRAGVRPRRLPR